MCERQLRALDECRDAEGAAQDALYARYLADRYFVAETLGLTHYAWVLFERELEEVPEVERLAVDVG
jgi:hypothetical protein